MEEARHRNANIPHLSIVKGELPADWLDEAAYLIILSEILYFLSTEETEQVAAKILARGKPMGTCILVNCLEPIPERLQAAEAAKLLITVVTDTISRAKSTMNNKYRIDTLTRK